MAFDRELDTVVVRVMTFTFEIIFMLGMLIRMCRGFEIDGIEVRDPDVIARHYLRGPFVTDLLASFPYTWLLGIRLTPLPDGSPPLSAVARLVPFCRIIRLVIPAMRDGETEVVKSIRRFRTGKANAGHATVAQLVFVFFLLCHWTGCLWWAVGTLEQDGLLTEASLQPRTWKLRTCWATPLLFGLQNRTMAEARGKRCCGRRLAQPRAAGHSVPTTTIP